MLAAGGHTANARTAAIALAVFEHDEIPPVGAFWSVTMYDAEGFPVSNPINRSAIGDRDGGQFRGRMLAWSIIFPAELSS